MIVIIKYKNKKWSIFSKIKTHMFFIYNLE